jgi:glycosyltransferase involved in cell wall biosynthesis
VNEPGSASRPLRTLVVQPYAQHGGSESWLLSMLDQTTALQPTVVLLQEGPLEAELNRRGVPTYVRSVGAGIGDIALASRWMYRWLRRDPPDVVLANVVKAQLIAGPAARLAGVPCVWAKHDHSYDRTLAIPLGRLATRVVGAVEELAAPVRRHDSVIVPPPRPDSPPLSRGAARRALSTGGQPLPADAPVVVMAGRLVPFKGVEDLIRALQLPGGRAWTAVIAGSDDHAARGETQRLRSIAAELGVSDRVLFWGYVEELSRYLAAFDALAVLTRRYGRRSPSKEGFGTSAFEAMLAGVPVVTVDAGAVARRLEGRAGLLVPPADPGAVADALSRLGDPGVRAAMGSAGRQITQQHPDGAAAAALLVQVLTDAAARAPRRTRRPSSGSSDRG